MGGFDPGDTLRAFLSIKIKARHDSYSDQISRIIVTKIFILTSVIMSIDWFHNEVNCIPPKDSNHLPEKFITQACWVRGFYVYPYLADHMSRSSFYGVPTELKMDGYLDSDPSSLCEVHPTGSRKRLHGSCVAMEKEYYTQYQWMPFFVSFMGFLFYYPYIIFRIANTDIISLKWNLKNTQVTPEQIVHSYFNHTINSKRRNRVRLITNYIVKVLYFFNGFFGFFFIDWLFNKRFVAYGSDWFKWASGKSGEKTDFRARTTPSPGNKFLPTFAMCYLDDIRLDALISYGNAVTVVCELSSHILYQYAFAVFWIVLIAIIVISFIGLLAHVFNHVMLFLSIRKKKEVRSFYNFMTIRGFEYLDFIRQRDLTMYSKILQLLNENVKLSNHEPLTFQAEEMTERRTRPLLRHINSIVDFDA